MNITARNYVGQAIKDCKSILDRLQAEDKPGWTVYEYITEQLESAQHFVLPDGGAIFNDGFKGLAKLPLRLPYPAITVEYWEPFTEEEIKTIEAKGQAAISKRLILITQLDNPEEVVLEEGVSFEADMILYQLAYLPTKYYPQLPHTGWSIYPFAWQMHREWQNPKYGPVPLVDKYSGITLYGMPLPLFPHILTNDGATEYRKWIGSIANDMGPEICAAMELCEALTCTNVDTEYHCKGDIDINRRREADGKTPIHDIKRLVVHTTQSRSDWKHSGNKAYQGLVKEHLRRGHIRRLQADKYKEKKNIWINNMLVGAKEKGTVQKTYVITK